jgi:hypothetical protein
MSRMEFHFGTAVAVATKQKGLRNKAQFIMDTLGKDILDDWNEEDDAWLEITDNNYLYMRDRDELVHFQNHEENEDGINRVKIRDDGFFRYYDFILSFYNGGASTEEALQRAIEKAEKKGKK